MKVEDLTCALLVAPDDLVVRATNKYRFRRDVGASNELHYLVAERSLPLQSIAGRFAGLSFFMPALSLALASALSFLLLECIPPQRHRPKEATKA